MVFDARRSEAERWGTMCPLDQWIERFPFCREGVTRQSRVVVGPARNEQGAEKGATAPHGDRPIQGDHQYAENHDIGRTRKSAAPLIMSRARASRRSVSAATSFVPHPVPIADTLPFRILGRSYAAQNHVTYSKRDSAHRAGRVDLLVLGDRAQAVGRTARLCKKIEEY